MRRGNAERKWHPELSEGTEQVEPPETALQHDGRGNRKRFRLGPSGWASLHHANVNSLHLLEPLRIPHYKGRTISVGVFRQTLRVYTAPANYRASVTGRGLVCARSTTGIMHAPLTSTQQSTQSRNIAGQLGPDSVSLPCGRITAPLALLENGRGRSRSPCQARQATRCPQAREKVTPTAIPRPSRPSHS